MKESSEGAGFLPRARHDTFCPEYLQTSSTSAETSNAVLRHTGGDITSQGERVRWSQNQIYLQSAEGSVTGTGRTILPSPETFTDDTRFVFPKSEKQSLHDANRTVRWGGKEKKKWQIHSMLGGHKEGRRILWRPPALRISTGAASQLAPESTKARKTRRNGKGSFLCNNSLRAASRSLCPPHASGRTF